MSYFTYDYDNRKINPKAQKKLDKALKNYNTHLLDKAIEEGAIIQEDKNGFNHLQKALINGQTGIALKLLDIAVAKDIVPVDIVTIYDEQNHRHIDKTQSKYDISPLHLAGAELKDEALVYKMLSILNKDENLNKIYGLSLFLKEDLPISNAPFQVLDINNYIESELSGCVDCSNVLDRFEGKISTDAFLKMFPSYFFNSIDSSNYDPFVYMPGITMQFLSNKLDSSKLSVGSIEETTVTGHDLFGLLHPYESFLNIQKEYVSYAAINYSDHEYKSIIVGLSQYTTQDIFKEFVDARPELDGDIEVISAQFINAVINTDREAAEEIIAAHDLDENIVCKKLAEVMPGIRDIEYAKEVEAEMCLQQDPTQTMLGHDIA